MHFYCMTNMAKSYQKKSFCPRAITVYNVGRAFHAHFILSANCSGGEKIFKDHFKIINVTVSPKNNVPRGKRP